MRARLDSNGRPGAWSTVALAPSGGDPYFIRGIALDDVDRSVVYVATYGSSASSGIGKVYRVSGAGGAAPVIDELVGGPRQAEELRTLDGHLYAAANDNVGCRCRRLPAGRRPDGAACDAVAAHRCRAIGHHRQVLRARDLQARRHHHPVGDERQRLAAGHHHGLQVHVAGHVDRRLRHRRLLGGPARRPRRHAQRHRRARTTRRSRSGGSTPITAGRASIRATRPAASP